MKGDLDKRSRVEVLIAKCFRRGHQRGPETRLRERFCLLAAERRFCNFQRGDPEAIRTRLRKRLCFLIHLAKTSVFWCPRIASTGVFGIKSLVAPTRKGFSAGWKLWITAVVIFNDCTECVARSCVQSKLDCVFVIGMFAALTKDTTAN